jgi:DNA-binding response OmpR family regulator
MKKRILLVDDEQSILDSFRRFFIKEGYEVTACLGGQEALDVLKRESFDLAILDVLMPGMTGVELAEKIRAEKKTAKLKIIFLTVVEKAGKDINKMVDHIDYVAWLKKPIEINVLRETVKEVFGA